MDKPPAVTSHDVVARVRRLAGTRKVGHAGTLDPAATGLLVLGLDSATRLLTYLVGLDKEYLATVRLGASTTTDDAEGEVVSTAGGAALAAATPEAVARAMRELTGAILQVPSSVSAIRIGGRRAYARVRDGEQVVLDARPVTVSAFDLLARRDADAAIELDVRVACSSGTYVRALARDLGAALGTGGHLTALRRTRVGPFSVDEAVPLDESVRDRALAPADAATRVHARLELDAAATRDLAHGRRVALDVPDGGPLAAVSPEGRLVAVVEVRGGALRSLATFPTDGVLA